MQESVNFGVILVTLEFAVKISAWDTVFEGTVLERSAWDNIAWDKRIRIIVLEIIVL